MILRCAAVVVFLAASVLPHGEGAAGNPCAGAESTLELISKALDEGRWEEAEQSIEPLELSHQDCGQVVVAMARLRAAHGDPDEAERLFSRALTLAPDDAVVHAFFARFQLSRGLGPQAAYLISQALAIDPDCTQALVIRGKMLGQRGLYGESRAVLGKAVALDPKSAAAHHELGMWFYRVGLFDQAARHFEAAVGLRPRWSSSLAYVALCLEMLGEGERAQRYYLDALQAQAKSGPLFDPTIEYNYGRFLLKQGRLEESLPYLDRAVALLPLRRGPRYQRSKLRLAQADYAAALQDAERALALGKPGDAVLDLQVYYLLTTIYSRMGKEELAKKYAELARTTATPDQADSLRRR